MASGTAQQQQIGAAEHFGVGATEHVPIVEVAFGYGKWWSIPQDMSSQLYEQYVNNQDACYTWDWGEGGRDGSWAPDGERTSINRYCRERELAGRRAQKIDPFQQNICAEKKPSFFICAVDDFEASSGWGGWFFVFVRFCSFFL